MIAPGAQGADLLRFLRDSAVPGNAIALEDGLRSLSYGELWDAVERCAAEFGPAAGAPERPLALVASNSIGYCVALLGGLAAGRTVAEISPQETPERLAALVSRLAPAALVTDLDDTSFASGARVVSPSVLPPAANRAAAARPADPALIVFTSGTTGEPKGVMLSHANIVAVVEAILDYLPLAGGDRHGLVLPLCHTYGKSVLFTALRTGGTVVLGADFADLPSFTGWLVERRVSVLGLVPFHVNVLLQRAPLERLDLSRLRLVTISGGAIRPEALAELDRRVPSAAVHFMYGLTESSTRACALPPEMLARKPGSCGRPIRGVRLRIAAEDGRPLGAREPGEVLLAGPNIMQGYWGDPGLTARTLGDGWLHTGDLGSIDADGYLYLVGRKNDIIKCAGERISAREIEVVLLSHPGVADVTVAGVPHPILGESVQAWVVRRDPAVSEDELRALCARRLTHHKIPRSWVFLPELPRTATGKVQRARLPVEQEQA
ncbi:MAG: AMP-binding protein [Acidobacteria bacterium]|nr:AMP-binding protein [Acidobacteriota bacterium]